MALRERLVQEAEQATFGFVHAASLAGAYPYGPAPSQDLYAVEIWDFNGQSWTFVMVLDGHSEGHNSTALFAREELPPMVQNALKTALGQTAQLEDIVVSKILSNAVTELDERIRNDFLALLPSDRASFDPSSLRDDSGAMRIEVARGLAGAAVCFAVIDPSNRVHVARLGDCDCLLTKPTGEGTWACTEIGVYHGGENTTEAARIAAEHPGEPDCFRNGRFFAGLNMTRGLGDLPLKLCAEDALLLFDGFPGDSSRGKARMALNLTPPYLSNVPDISHASMPLGSSLLIASDGLSDLVRSRGRYLDRLASACAEVLPSTSTWETNAALELIWHVCEAAEESALATRLLTGKPPGRVDDITVVVVRAVEEIPHLLAKCVRR